MIAGHVTDDGIPVIVLEVGDQQWRAIIDTGFNGDVELPESLQSQLDGECVGRVSSLLAAGQRIEEDIYLVDFPFDGQTRSVQATFVSSEEALRRNSSSSCAVSQSKRRLQAISIFKEGAEMAL